MSKYPTPKLFNPSQEDKERIGKKIAANLLDKQYDNYNQYLIHNWKEEDLERQGNAKEKLSELSDNLTKWIKT